MSRGNMMLGMARGKVGDIVFARRLGQQTTRAYNGSVADTRSSSQVLQRARMGNMVNQYRALRAVMPRAFEFKPTGNTDYNRYAHFGLRETIIPLDQYQSSNGQAVFSPRTRISVGSLNPLELAAATNASPILGINLGVVDMTGITTEGEFWLRMIDANPTLRNGDQLLLAVINGVGASAVAPISPGTPLLNYREIQVDVTSESVATVGTENTVSFDHGLYTYTFGEDDADRMLQLSFPAIEGARVIGKFAIQSRIDAGGKLQVSNSFLELTTIGLTIFNAYNTLQHLAEVELSYNAQPSAPLTPDRELNFPIEIE